MKFFLILLFFVPLFAIAQTPHTVQAKETLYSLARKYNVHPRELAAYNNIPVETSLTVGQVIRIPLKTTMAPLPAVAPAKTEAVEKKPEAEKTKAPVVKEPVEKQVIAPKATSPMNKVEPPFEAVPVQKETSYPVYHKVAKKESLYAISRKYNNVSIADLKKWNKLSGEGLSEGMNMIVGYSKTKPAEKTGEPVAKEEKPAVTAEPVAAKSNPVETKPAETEIKAVPAPVKEEVKKVADKDFNGGVFKALYEEQKSAKRTTVDEKGLAGLFKSTSGWEDGKYYCLSNSVPAGTIVKVTNPSNQRSIYAKVLDLIPDLKQNAGIIIRISDAGAAALAAGNDNFECTINF